MHCSRLALHLGATLLGLSAAATAQGVVINEFSYDDTGTDDREYVELYNASTGTVDIGGWVLDARDQVGANKVFTIPASTMLAPGAFWVMGSALVTNVNQVVGATDNWENDMETLTLRDTTTAIVDSVVYETNKATFVVTAPELEGEGVWGNLTNNDATPTSWSRVKDGRDTNNNGLDFVLLPATPGTSNNLACSSYTDNFDAKLPEATLAEWIGSFVTPRAIDPTLISASNPNAIAASPQGGNAAIFWDPSGGGNGAVLRMQVLEPTTFEAWVYFDAVPEAGTENETWSVGFGSEGTFYNTPDPGGVLGLTAIANGNTGVTWTYQVTAAGGVLYFIDHNDGGYAPSALTLPTVVGSIAITPGTNDGWRRLKLQRQAGTVTGTFDGTTSFSAPSSHTGPTTLFIGYREAVVTNAGARPFTADDISLTGVTAQVLPYGTAAPTTAGTPTLGTNGQPTIGNAGFVVTASGMVPNAGGAILIGVVKLIPPFDLTLAGAQVGAFLHLVPVVTVPVASDGSGNGGLALPLSCDLPLGAPVAFQLFDLDPSLPDPLPIGTSAGLEIIIGN